MIVTLRHITPELTAVGVAERAKALRISKNLTREELSERSAVPISTIRRFETTGLAPFLTVVRLAYAMDCKQGLGGLFKAPEDLPNTIEQLVEAETRKPRIRARRKRD